MPKILIPTDYTKWLPEETKASTALTAKITELKKAESDTITLKKKNFSGKIVFTVDVNVEGFHRLLFVKINKDHEIFYVLAGIALYHDYDKAIRGIPQSFSFDKSDYDDIDSEPKASKCTIDESPEENMVFYSQSWISLSDEQAAALGDGETKLSLPRMVMGPPGSGKSLVSVGFFQDQVVQYLESIRGLDEAEEITPLRLLYVSPQIELNRRLASEWTSWLDTSSVPVALRAHIQLDVKLPVELLGVPGEVTWSSEQTIAKIVELLEAKKRSCASGRPAIKKRGGVGSKVSDELASLTPQILYNEFWVSSLILNEDFNAEKSFDDSSYSKIGDRQTTIRDIAQRKVAYEIYGQLINTRSAPAAAAARSERLIKFAGLSSASSALPKYHWVVADEAQNCSPQEIVNIFSQAEDHHFIGSFDSYQRADIPKSSVEIFVVDFFRRFEYQLPISELQGTHRLGHGVASTCNELIKLFNVLQDGKDALAYSSIKSLQTLPEGIEAETKVSLIYPAALAGQAAELCSDANFAVLVLDNADKDRLLTALGMETASTLINIFSIDEARGLQFSKVVVYLSAETLNLFKTVSEVMTKADISAAAELKIVEKKVPRDSDYRFEMLSRLMVALSRSLADAWICCEKSAPRHVERFYDWLKAECSGVRKLEAKASTEIEWLILTHHFIALGVENHPTALNYLTTKLKISRSLATRYIAQAHRKILDKTSTSHEEDLRLLKQMQREAVVAEDSTLDEEIAAGRAVRITSARAGEAATSKETRAEKPSEDTKRTHQRPRREAVPPIIPVSKTMADFLKVIRENDFKSFKTFLKEVDDVDSVKGLKEITLLCSAVMLGKIQFVKFLLEKGAKIDLSYVDGLTPLCIAIEHDYQEIAEHLLEKNASADASDKEGTTPLISAAKRDNVRIANRLLAKGVDINRSSIEGYTALFAAAQFNSEKVLNLLLTRGAIVDKAAKDGSTPLFIAVQKNKLQAVHILLKNSAKVDIARITDGTTPLLIAAHHGHDVLVDLLLDKGAKVDGTDSEGCTPLLIAVMKNHTETVRILLEKGADINVPMTDGQTPLSLSDAPKCHRVIKQLLLKAKAKEESCKADITRPRLAPG